MELTVYFVFQPYSCPYKDKTDEPSNITGCITCVDYRSPCLLHGVSILALTDFYTVFRLQYLLPSSVV